MKLVIYRNWLLKLLYPRTVTSITFFNLAGKILGGVAICFAFYLAYDGIGFLQEYPHMVFYNPTTFQFVKIFFAIVFLSAVVVFVCGTVLVSGYYLLCGLLDGFNQIREWLDFDISILDKVEDYDEN